MIVQYFLTRRGILVHLLNLDFRRNFSNLINLVWNLSKISSPLSSSWNNLTLDELLCAYLLPVKISQSIHFFLKALYSLKWKELLNHGKIFRTMTIYNEVNKNLKFFLNPLLILLNCGLFLHFLNYLHLFSLLFSVRIYILFSLCDLILSNICPFTIFR